jgi:pimeloyl-ACP methyl ester carboxylesterase
MRQDSLVNDAFRYPGHAPGVRATTSLGAQNGRVMESIEVDGMRIAFEMAGAGPPLVLLHGYVGDGWTTWRRQIEGLCDQFTVVAWDAPGAGGSSDPPEFLGMAGYADAVAGFVAGLGLENPHVAGLSFGGALAIELSRRHPAIPRTLVLASSYAGWGGSLPQRVAEQRLRQALAVSSLPPDEFTAALLSSMFSEGTASETLEEFGSSMRAFHPVGFSAMARASAEDLSDALTRVRVPTLLLYGDKDIRAPLSVARQLHSAIPGSSLVVLPDVGHICNIEASGGFNAAVRSFLLDHSD